MNIAYSRHTGQRISGIEDELIVKYNSAEWLINPTQEEIDALQFKIEVIELRKNLRKVGQKYVDIVLSEFLSQLTTSKQAVIYLDNLLSQVKIQMNQGEFISARETLESIETDLIFSEGYKGKFLAEINDLINTYYPPEMVARMVN